ncbi:hypothetical protein [Actinophytocola sp.]|uniref:hypothetical protein n=1 Tax=Actinophytocola sp. TaxID=1872138 RepID=UPI002ED4836B
MNLGRKITVLALLVVLAACTSPDERPPTGSTSTKAVLADQRLRPVRMTSGRALTYVQPETASQILCNLLDKEGWERLLDSRIGRTPMDYPYAGCVIATERGRLRIQMRESEDAFEPRTTIAGRPATTYERLRGDVVFILALTDEALRPVPPGRKLTLRTLEVEASGEQPESEREVVTRVLTEIVPLLVKEADPLPDMDDQGNVSYVNTLLSGGGQFVDLPLPVQALQLCTFLLEDAGFRAVVNEFSVSDTGRCTVLTEQGAAVAETKHAVGSSDTYPDTIAGRPASAKPPVVNVRLRDDVAVDLYVSAPDSVAVVEKLVPLLLN